MSHNMFEVTLVFTDAFRKHEFIVTRLINVKRTKQKNDVPVERFIGHPGDFIAHKGIGWLLCGSKKIKPEIIIFNYSIVIISSSIVH